MPTGVGPDVGPDVARHVNETTQWAFTIGNWSLALVAIVVAFLLARRMGRSTPVVIVLLGGLCGTFTEPLFDSYFHLWFYDVGQWNFMKVHGISQPVWVMPTYFWFYGGQALVVYKLVADGASRQRILGVAGAIFVVATCFELIGISLGVYEYWGPQALSVNGFPVWLSGENAAIPVVTALVVTRLEPHATGVRRPLLALVTPGVAMAFWYATGFPVINLMNSPDPSQFLLDVAAIASMAAGVVVLSVVVRALMPDADAVPAAPGPAEAGPAPTASEPRRSPRPTAAFATCRAADAHVVRAAGDAARGRS